MACNVMFIVQVYTEIDVLQYIKYKITDNCCNRVTNLSYSDRFFVTKITKSFQVILLVGFFCEFLKTSFRPVLEGGRGLKCPFNERIRSMSYMARSFEQSIICFLLIYEQLLHCYCPVTYFYENIEHKCIIIVKGIIHMDKWLPPVF